MLTLSLAKCINATKNGEFSIRDLDLIDPLSYDDVIFLSEYLKITPVTGLDLSMTVTKENSEALESLGQVIAQNSLLKKLVFEVTLNFDFYFKDKLPIGLFDFIDEYRLKKIATRVHNTFISMLNNKPALNKLTVDLLSLETHLENKHIRGLTQAVNKSPLTYLNLALSVDKGAQIPLFNTKQPNQSLRFLMLRGFTSGRDVLKYLPQASALKMLAIGDMLFDKDDLPLLDQIMKANPSLDTLILGKTNIGQINSPRVFSWLTSCPKLNSLALVENNLSLLNIESLCEFLGSAPETLKELDLSKNAYMAGDAIKIAKALASNTHLEELVLDDNYIEDEGLQAIINLVKTNKNITSISVSNTCRYNPSNETIRLLCDLLLDPQCQLKELKFNQDITLAQYLMVQYALDSNNSLEFIDIKFRNQNILEMIFGKNNSSDLSNHEFSTDNPVTTDNTNHKEERLSDSLNHPTIKSTKLFSPPPQNRDEDNGKQLAPLSNHGVGLH